MIAEGQTHVISHNHDSQQHQSDDDDIEEVLCCIEFPELAKTNYMSSFLNENSEVVMNIRQNNPTDKDRSVVGRHLTTLSSTKDSEPTYQLRLDGQFEFVGTPASPYGTNLFFQLPTLPSSTAIDHSLSTAPPPYHHPTAATTTTATPTPTLSASGQGSRSSVLPQDCSILHKHHPNTVTYLGHSRFSISFDIYQEQQELFRSRGRLATRETSTAVLDWPPSPSPTAPSSNSSNGILLPQQQDQAQQQQDQAAFRNDRCSLDSGDWLYT